MACRPGPGESFQCKQCRDVVSFGSLRAIRDHSKSTHRQMKHSCALCGKCFPTAVDLEMHGRPAEASEEEASEEEEELEASEEEASEDEEELEASEEEASEEELEASEEDEE